MKGVIYYFSGTGNTEKVVKEYVKTFEELGSSLEARKIEENHAFDKAQDIDLSEYDLLGIAYPIHAFNAPSIVLKFIKKIKKQPVKTRLFIVKTSGEPLALNNISSTKVKSILKKRNFELDNEYHYCMPYNIIFRHTDNMAYKMWNTAQNLIPIDALEILNGKKRTLKYLPLASALAAIMRVEHWGGRFNGRKYKVNEKCIKCQKCVRACPTNNIKIDENGNFHFGKNCLMCMRCSFFCPTDAIKIGFFEKWKVNGAYNFEKPNENEVEKHKRYCKNAYRKYFARADAKIKANLKIAIDIEEKSAK